MSQRVAGPVRPPAAEDAARPTMPGWVERSAPRAAIWTGFGAAAVGCFIAVVAALVSWIPDADATGSSGSVVRAGVLTFLTAQHGGVHLNGVTVQFVPLGLTLISVWLCWRAGTVLQTLPVVRADRRPRRVLGLASAQTAAYALTCAILTHYGRIGSTWSPTLPVTAASAVVAGVGFGASAVLRTPLGRRRWRGLPRPIRSGLRAGAASIAVFIGAGALLALGATVTRAGRFLDLSRGIGRGLSGLPIAALDLLAAPNAVIASTAYLAGPGFAVGVHSTYAPFGGSSGLVPGFPILAGLPGDDRAGLTVLVLMVLAVGGAGVASARLVRGSAPRAGWWEMLGSCVVSGVVAGGGLALLAAAAGGSMGRQNLRAVGASPWQVLLFTTAEVLAVSLPVAVISRLIGTYAGRLWRAIRTDRRTPVDGVAAAAAMPPVPPVPPAVRPSVPAAAARPSVPAAPTAPSPPDVVEADGDARRREAS